jgi:hypothetical protein
LITEVYNTPQINVIYFIVPPGITLVAALNKVLTVSQLPNMAYAAPAAYSFNIWTLKNWARQDIMTYGNQNSATASAFNSLTVSASSLF